MERYNSLKDLLGLKIIDILFTKKPESSKPYDCDAYYSVDQGGVVLVLDDETTLEFFNSEWGGMAVNRKEKSLSGRNIPREYYSEDERDVL